MFLWLIVRYFYGSFFSFLMMLGYIPLVAKRIANEEMVLENGLEGYKDYKKKVRYKMVPLLW